ncbi:MAG: rod shape-determining protein MreC [Deltaproteobacteria bacterium CG_4_10_14_0_2_um_filter_43_8]|nr:MAG: rod shape-determining protein MreC [Deltaproteobacteria bacterium CG11_big_fil_rev_8_21_14_0_20_42_23]PJA20613.1 MAG: rod shape-determining protein MreC [Deltaproteobacteria bacterium CG_4_10_14_0_2_um_filter_43_8]PJC65231.1 MAG: rod shape-determining protein MreC [Deltaproteobacteria bacterium CG_4_9_14_0_2_um_filter_42_21]
MSDYSRRFRILRFFIPLLLFLIFFSFTRYGARRAPWYEQALWNVVEPFQNVFSFVGQGVHSTWNNYIALVHTKKINLRLTNQVSKLKGQLIYLEELQQENERLKQLLHYQDMEQWEPIMARVIAHDPQTEISSIVINRGTADGLQVYMPVVVGEGVVGRIGEVGKHRSHVLLLDDVNSVVDVFIERSQTRALLVGKSKKAKVQGGVASLDYLHRASDVKEGDVVITSGLDEIYPSGLKAGVVHKVEVSEYGVFQKADLIPVRDFSQLREVAVLMKKTR